MPSILQKRTNQIKANYDNLVGLEDIYTKITYDFGLLTDELTKYLKSSQTKKTELKKLELKSMAEFEREYEISDEYILIKACKYQLEALGRLMSGVRVRIDSLKSQLKGEY